MFRRVALWAAAGCAVALLWALSFYLLGPSRGQYPGQAALLHSLGGSPLLVITAPVALFGHHHALTWQASAGINALIYAAFGLAVEAIRPLFPGRLRPLRGSR